MTKSETRALAELETLIRQGFTVDQDHMIGYAARAYSALIRATGTLQNRNEMICAAGGVPAIVQHPDFRI